MPEMLSQIYKLLTDVILPHLKSIQIGQAEQQLQSERLNRNLEEFRAEIQMRLAEVRVEIGACRQEMEDMAVTIRENDAAENTEASPRKKRIIH